jgi:hypothetical protein
MEHNALNCSLNLDGIQLFIFFLPSNWVTTSSILFAVCLSVPWIHSNYNVRIYRCSVIWLLFWVRHHKWQNLVLLGAVIIALFQDFITLLLLG